MYVNVWIVVCRRYVILQVSDETAKNTQKIHKMKQNPRVYQIRRKKGHCDRLLMETIKRYVRKEDDTHYKAFSNGIK